MSQSLETLVKSYLENRAQFRATMDNNGDQITEESCNIANKLADLQEEIMKILPYAVVIAKTTSGRYILRQKAERGLIKLVPNNDETVVKFISHLTTKVSEATKFETREEAEAQLGPVNYALFRAYIEDMKEKIA